MQEALIPTDSGCIQNESSQYGRRDLINDLIALIALTTSDEA